jgi:hypothetical protein
MVASATTRMNQFDPAIALSDTDLLYGFQTNEVKMTVAQVRTVLAANAQTETFIAGNGITPGTFLPGGSSITLANLYGSISNIDVYADAAPQLDSTLSGYVLGFPNGGIPTGVSKIVIKGGTARSIGVPADASVTDVKAAPGSKLYNRIYNHPEVADAGTVTTASVAASVAAVQAAGGGTLIFANGSYSGVALPSNYAGAVLQYMGPNVPACLFGEPLGSAFLAQQVIRSQNAGGHAGIGGVMVSMENAVVGTGAIGPLNADYTLTVSLLKQNAPTTTQAGELDASYFVVRNGGPNSDTTAILADVGQYGVGFNAFFEASISILDPSTSLPTKRIDVQSGVLDNRNNVYAGHVVSVSDGALGAAYFAQQSASSSWSSVLQFAAHGAVTFDIPVAGGVPSIALYDGVGGKKTIHVAANAIAFVNAAGTAEILNVSDTGSLSEISSVNINAGGNYAINSVQLLSGRTSGYGTPTGASRIANFNAATATPSQTAALLAQIILDDQVQGFRGV